MKTNKDNVAICREVLLERALAAAQNVIGWYEMEHDRDNYDDEDMPEDLVESEQELNFAIEALENFDKGKK
ncbi:hypothetical protein C4577_05050 [Candidatus Parcubacteria bacterium]|nr:MAG: hypothetical protein C4577_05050 [Candidatus Parcubacteria bacterium]